MPYGEIGERPLSHAVVASAREVGLPHRGGRPRAPPGRARGAGGGTGRRLAARPHSCRRRGAVLHRYPHPRDTGANPDRGTGELRGPAVRRHPWGGDRRDQRRRSGRGDIAGDRARAGDVVGGARPRHARWQQQDCGRTHLDEVPDLSDSGVAHRATVGRAVAQQRRTGHVPRARYPPFAGGAPKLG